MNTQTTSTGHYITDSLIRRFRYYHGVPFIASCALAAVTVAWFVHPPSFLNAPKGATWILTALISTAVTLFFGGRFRAFFTAIAVTPPFVFLIGWLLYLRSTMSDFEFSQDLSREIGLAFLWLVALPILLGWVVATLFNRNDRNA